MQAGRLPGENLYPIIRDKIFVFVLLSALTLKTSGQLVRDFKNSYSKQLWIQNVFVTETPKEKICMKLSASVLFVHLTTLTLII